MFLINPNSTNTTEEVLDDFDFHFNRILYPDNAVIEDSMIKCNFNESINKADYEYIGNFSIMRKLMANYNKLNRLPLNTVIKGAIFEYRWIILFFTTLPESEYVSSNIQWTLINKTEERKWFLEKNYWYITNCNNFDLSGQFFTSKLVYVLDEYRIIYNLMPYNDFAKWNYKTSSGCYNISGNVKVNNLDISKFNSTINTNYKENIKSFFEKHKEKEQKIIELEKCIEEKNQKIIELEKRIDELEKVIEY